MAYKIKENASDICGVIKYAKEFGIEQYKSGENCNNFLGAKNNDSPMLV